MGDRFCVKGKFELIDRIYSTPDFNLCVFHNYLSNSDKLLFDNSTDLTPEFVKNHKAYNILFNPLSHNKFSTILYASEDLNTLVTCLLPNFVPSRSDFEKIVEIQQEYDVVFLNQLRWTKVNDQLYYLDLENIALLTDKIKHLSNLIFHHITSEKLIITSIDDRYSDIDISPYPEIHEYVRFNDFISILNDQANNSRLS